MFRCGYLVSIFLLFVAIKHIDSQNFGDDIDSVGFGGDVVSRNEDHRFADMGQVTKDVFDVSGGIVNFTLNVQDTDGVKELWILDFQPYLYDDNALPIDPNTGDLIAENTGPCSSVYENQGFDTFLDDNYWDTLSGAPLTGKNLFTATERASTLDDDNRRNNKIHFTGSIDTWFDCTESDESTKVWQLTSDADDIDEIEYRTKLYAINVRPKDESNAAGGISFVQSHIELIWRLSRTALSTVIISSTALLQPILEFARVYAVFDDQGDPIVSQAMLHLRFRTAVDSSEQMVEYVTDSIVYTPDNQALTHGLAYTISEPVSSFLNGPQCEFLLDDGTQSQLQCNQVWEFQFVLDIDITGHVDNRAPIDASGTFEFDFNQYVCLSNTNQFDVSLCAPLGTDPAKVAALITIQTTVFVQDEEDDQVAILLVALKGADNQELSVDGARGIAHKEDITLEVKFSPAILRTDYKLDLMLFMVCRGQQYLGDLYPHGCLQADALDRYVAHRSSDFAYTPRYRNSTGLYNDAPYDFSHVSADYFQALSFQGYVENDEFARPLPVPVHRSTFTNVALSADQDDYVITTVYRLDDKVGRKRRLASGGGNSVDDAANSKDLVISSMGLGQVAAQRHAVLERYRRDIDDSAAAAHSQRYAYKSIGCPENAVHKDMDCHCPAGMEYSTRSFECVIDNSLVISNVIDPVLDEESRDSGTGSIHQATTTTAFAIILCARFLVMLYV